MGPRYFRFITLFSLGTLILLPLLSHVSSQFGSSLSSSSTTPRFPTLQPKVWPHGDPEVLPAPLSLTALTSQPHFSLRWALASISSAVTQRTPCPQGTQTLSYHPDATLERSEKRGTFQCSSGLPPPCYNSLITSKRLHFPACPLRHSLGAVCLPPASLWSEERSYTP